MDIEITRASGDGDLGSLERWLAREPGLRGRVRARTEGPPAGTMGLGADALLVMLSPDGVAGVLLGAVVTWLTQRRPRRPAAAGESTPPAVTTLRITRPDGGSFEISTGHLESMSPAELRAHVAQLAALLEPPAGTD